jgi:ATP-binding cassette subfamily B protein AbcA/BmrA
MDTQTQMNSNTLHNEKNKKESVWKPFFMLIKQTKLPYLFIFLSFVFSIGGAQLGLLFPDATKNIIAGDISKGAIIRMLTIMFSSAAVGGIGTLLARVTSAKVSLSFRRLMVEKALKLPVPYYDKNMADRLISRTTTDTTMMSDFIGDIVPGLPASIYRFIGTIVILFSYDWRLVVLEAIMIPLVYLLVLIQGKLVYKYANIIQGKIAELTGYLYEVLSNIPLVKVFVKEDKEEKRGQENINTLYKTKLKYTGVAMSLGLIQQMQSVIQTIICVVGGAYLVTNKYISYYLFSLKPVSFALMISVILTL